MFLLRYGFKPKEFLKAAETQTLVISTRDRVKIWVPAGILMICAVIFAGFYFARFNSIKRIQDFAKDYPNYTDDKVYYDTLCSTDLVTLYTN